MAIPPIQRDSQIQTSNSSGQILNIQASKKLIQQLTNNPLGNVGYYSDASHFRSTMDAAFRSAITDKNLLQSIKSGTDIQQKCLTQMAKGEAPQLDQSDLTHFNGPLPKHLHLSYLGTQTHSVDIVITKNNHGVFVTVCNRGRRNSHDVFETYKLCENTISNPVSEINNLLIKLNNVERNNGDIEAFYKSFGSNNKIKNNELESINLKEPPSAKNQKAGNCVRTSISAAHKWIAHQHDCMAAHKSVKKTILESTKNIIEAKIKEFNSDSQQHIPYSPKPVENILKIDRAASYNETLKIIENSLKVIENTPKPYLKTTTDLIESLPQLVYSFCDFQTKKLDFIKDNEEIIKNILEILLKLQQDHKQIIENIKASLMLSN